MHYRPEIDGLRSVAVLLVFIFHLFPKTITGGFIGVDVFFVISGFLITSIIIKDIELKKFSFLQFYSRRVKRIFPALFFLLLVTAIMSVLFLGEKDYLDFLKTLRFAAGQVSNILFSRNVDYFASGHDHSPLLHTWSLGVEEQFYLFWPLLLVFLSRFPRNAKIVTLMVLCFGSLILSEYLSRFYPKQSFYFVHSRLWELGAGGLIAYVKNKNYFPVKINGILSLLGLILIFASSLLLDSSSRFPGIHAIPTVIGSALIIYCTSGGEVHWVKKFLSSRLMVFIGKISYSLYLWHWPLIAYVQNYQQTPITIKQSLVIVPLAFVFSYLSWKFIENPFRKSKNETGKYKIKVIISGVSIALLMIVFANTLKSTANASWRFIGSPLEKENIINQAHEGCGLTEKRLESNDINLKDCVFGPHPEKPEVVLMGDSHSSHFFPAFIHWAEKNQLTVRLYATSTCPSLFGKYNLYQRSQHFPRCQMFAKKMEEAILSQSSIRLVVLAMRTTLYSETHGAQDEHIKTFLTNDKYSEFSRENSRVILKENLNKTVEKIKASGKQVLLMSQVPELKSNPIKCVENTKVLVAKVYPKDEAPCYQFDDSWVNNRTQFEKEIFKEQVQNNGVLVFDPKKHFLSAKPQEKILYFDDNHINEGGADYISQFFDFKFSL